MADDIKKLQRQLVSATKTLNSRLRRLRKEDLPASSFERLETAKNMHHPIITPSGYISSSYAGLTEKQLKSRLQWVRGITQQTETVKQAREMVKRRMQEWNVDETTAKERIRSGRVFAQVLNANPLIFESDDVNDTITQFDSTPTYEQLENALYKQHGREIADTADGREYVRRWIERTRELPIGVQGRFTSNGGFLFENELSGNDNDNEV